METRGVGSFAPKRAIGAIRLEGKGGHYERPVREKSWDPVVEPNTVLPRSLGLVYGRGSW